MSPPITQGRFEPPSPPESPVLGGNTEGVVEAAAVAALIAVDDGAAVGWTAVAVAAAVVAVAVAAVVALAEGVAVAAGAVLVAAGVLVAAVVAVGCGVFVGASAPVTTTVPCMLGWMAQW